MEVKYGLLILWGKYKVPNTVHVKKLTLWLEFSKVGKVLYFTKLQVTPN